MDNSHPKKRFSLGRVAQLAFRALAMLLALLVGWVASYRWRLVASRNRDGQWLQLHSYCGSLEIFCLNLNTMQRSSALLRSRPSQFRAYQAFATAQEKYSETFFFRLQFETPDVQRWAIKAPYWFLTTLAAMAAAISFKRTWRFTTRELFLATTVLALLLGAVAWSMRG